MWLVYWSHPRSKSLIKEDVLCIERFKLRIFCRSNLLRYKVVRTKVKSKTDDANRGSPEAHNLNKKHKEMQPTFITKSNTKDLRPESVSRNHRIRLFLLSRFKCFESI